MTLNLMGGWLKTKPKQSATANNKRYLIYRKEKVCEPFGMLCFPAVISHKMRSDVHRSQGY